MTEQNPLVFSDAAALRAWLDEQEDVHDGGWLLLAKKGTTQPTSLSYQEALLEALCSGWIDGQRKSVDEATFMIRFTPRRRRSIWSQRNVKLVAELIDQGRMRARGHAEIDLAKADGRWERAYPGAKELRVPEDLISALAKNPVAKRAFDALDRTEWFSALHPIINASTPGLRASRVSRLIERLDASASADD